MAREKGREEEKKKEERIKKKIKLKNSALKQFKVACKS